MQLVNGLHGLLAGLSPLSIKSLDQITELQRQLANVIREFDDQPKELFDVSAGFVHNSDVLAAGRIIVHSGGCAYSRLWSGTGVKIESGVFRGSTLTVHAGNVVIKEVGSRAGRRRGSKSSPKARSGPVSSTRGSWWPSATAATRFAMKRWTCACAWWTASCEFRALNATAATRRPHHARLAKISSRRPSATAIRWSAQP